MIDAAMRSLIATGWVTFRTRAMLVSFASYHLWLDWRPTARVLAGRFIDFEPGIHYSQAQMQSGVTGINTIRIYAPTKQARDVDPHGEFIREWLPELRDVHDAYLLDPAKMPGHVQRSIGCVVGRDYPVPVVDEAAAYARAKARIFEWKESASVRAHARRVFERHGSRAGARPRGRARSSDGSGVTNLDLFEE